VFLQNRVSTSWIYRAGIIQLIKQHLKFLKRDQLMTAILIFMLWGISLAVTQVSWLCLQFLCSPLIGIFFSNYQAGIIYYFYFFIGSQAMSPEYVSSYGLIEQITELQDELQYLQHEVENVLPRERGRCTDELWVVLAHCACALPFPPLSRPQMRHSWTLH